jgi:hypothetical protein
LVVETSAIELNKSTAWHFNKGDFMTTDRMVQIEGASLGVPYEDSGPWRGYELYTHGESLFELLENAQISEVDQDGGELDCYALADAYGNVATAATCLIIRKYDIKARIRFLDGQGLTEDAFKCVKCFGTGLGEHDLACPVCRGFGKVA